MVNKSPRRRRRVRVRNPAKKKVVISGTQPGANIQALRKRIAQLEVNTSPFASVGGTVGKKIGGFFGNPNLGGNVGSWLGSGIGKIFGSGAYKMSKNSVWSTSDQVPVMHSTSEAVVVRHREYIGDINSSVGFVNTEFAINPGLSGTFPFAASIAQNFQEYNFRGLVFEFKSTSADALNSTNTALGTVAMAVQYRANATSFSNKQQVLNEMWSADSKPSCSFFMPVECAPSECPMDIQYIRTGTLAASDDIKFYDLGKLSVSTVGSQAAAVVGELWATYEVAFHKPILSGAINAAIPSLVMFRTGAVSATPLGAFTSTGINTINATVSTSQIIIPGGNINGKLILAITWFCAAGTVAIPNITISNSVGISLGGSVPALTGSGTNSTGGAATFMWSVVDPAASTGITVFTNGTLPTSFVDITITPVDFDVVAT
jgi:hypothetical protein